VRRCPMSVDDDNVFQDRIVRLSSLAVTHQFHEQDSAFTDVPVKRDDCRLSRPHSSVTAAL